ncbi:MAG TPA: hypothetical protein PLM07_18035 [Candidatus Rifleibacterium sp.]|nr:hypothetical protein [Candidatus Rifleibacterium sp.]HPT47782.1 hypothetical protein [Candidatus Rifleibacterium sp.]
MQRGIKRGTTIVELMMGLVILTLILTALWQVYSGSQRQAREILANHTINDDLDRTLLKITDDVRESNFIYDNFPPAVLQTAVAGLKTEDAVNQLKFTKVLYDFSKDPMDLPAGEVNYVQHEVRYYIEKDDDEDPGSPWVLCREMTPYDNKKNKVDSEMTVYPVLKGIKECIFYRVKDPDASRSGNVYIKLKLARKEEGQDAGKYTNEIVITVKERGASPE